MNFWLAAVLIVGIGALGEIYRARLKNDAGKAEESIKKIENRIARVEERMANIETIVLEKEKRRTYDQL